MGDMGNDPARESATCGHPEIGVGTDNTNSAEAPSTAVPLGDAYATRHDPFVYFHSIIDSPGCKTHVVNLDQHLKADLARASTTPNLVFITPNLCDDGHDGSGTGAPGTTCANGQPGGLTSIDAFLQKSVPQIMASQAYKEDGLLIITFDESSYTLNESTNSGAGQTTVDITFPGQTCCNEQPGPNLSGVRPGSVTLVNTPTLVENIVVDGYGGDRIGALLLSPFVKPGSTSETTYNHYSLLRSLRISSGCTSIWVTRPTTRALVITWKPLATIATFSSMTTGRSSATSRFPGSNGRAVGLRCRVLTLLCQDPAGAVVCWRSKRSGARCCVAMVGSAKPSRHEPGPRSSPPWAKRFSSIPRSRLQGACPVQPVTIPNTPTALQTDRPCSWVGRPWIAKARARSRPYAMY